MVMVIGMAMTLIIYMFLMLYGGQVMSSVMQEKNQPNCGSNGFIGKTFRADDRQNHQYRTGRPHPTGHLDSFYHRDIFVCGSDFLFLAVVWIRPISKNMTAVAGSMNGVDAAQLTGKMGAMQEIQNMLGSINLTQLLICFVLFFIGGYILYASLFAAIGSAVDNESDTQQFMVPITFIIIFALYAGIFSAENP